jgi:DNA helicase IV
LATDGDGALTDEVRARVEGVPETYGHVIVDEAQDLTLLQLRAVQRRARGLSLVGDDAQRSVAHGLGLRGAGRLLGVEPAEMATAYRMSAEIAAWLNAHAEAAGIDAVRLLGIRPTDRPVRELTAAPQSDLDAIGADLARRWSTTARIRAGDAWSHKGVEYDAVLVEANGMSPGELYLAASRAAHELVIATP